MTDDNGLFDGKKNLTVSDGGSAFMEQYHDSRPSYLLTGIRALQHPATVTTSSSPLTSNIWKTLHSPVFVWQRQYMGEQQSRDLPAASGDSLQSAFQGWKLIFD